MTKAREYSLFQFPGIRITSLQHVAAMVRLDNDRGAASQAFGYQRGHVTKVHQGGNFHALMSRREAEVVYRIMRDSERMKIYFTDPKITARLDWLNTITKRFRTSLRFVVGDVESFTNVRIVCLS